MWLKVDLVLTNSKYCGKLVSGLCHFRLQLRALMTEECLLQRDSLGAD